MRLSPAHLYQYWHSRETALHVQSYSGFFNFLKYYLNIFLILQQEANLFDEKKDYHYRGILRRYRKFEEHMTDAGKDRDPDICALVFCFNYFLNY